MLLSWILITTDYLDLLVVGESVTETGNGVFLYHNDGTGKLWAVLNILPETLRSGRDILTFDYNDDGDIDVVDNRDGWKYSSTSK